MIAINEWGEETRMLFRRKVVRSSCVKYFSEAQQSTSGYLHLYIAYLKIATNRYSRGFNFTVSIIKASSL